MALPKHGIRITNPTQASKTITMLLIECELLLEIKSPKSTNAEWSNLRARKVMNPILFRVLLSS